MVPTNGIGPQYTYWNEGERGPVGLFEYNSKKSFKDIPDGTSNTILLSEFKTYSGGDNYDIRGVLYYSEGPFLQFNYTPNSPIPDIMRNLYCPNTYVSPPCVGGFTSYTTRESIFTSRSAHPGGVQLLLADGAVRFVGNSIDLTTWQNLGMHNDGNVIGEF